MKDPNLVDLKNRVGRYVRMVDNRGYLGYLCLVHEQPHSRILWPFYQARSFELITREEYDQAEARTKIWHHFDYLYEDKSGEPIWRVLMALSNQIGFLLERDVQSHEDVPGHTWKTEIILVGE